MSWVLAIEPYDDQRALLRQATGTEVHAQLTIVDSVEEALSALTRRLPEVILLSPLVAPADETRLVAHVRALPNSAFVQILTTPRLTSFAPPSQMVQRWRPFSARRPDEAFGCAPAVFGEQLYAYLDRAVRARLELAGDLLRAPTPHAGRFGRAGAERRDARRLRAEAHARLIVGGSTVDLVDLSLTGAQIVSSGLLVPGRVVPVVARDLGDTRQFEAEIVWGVLEMGESARLPQYRAGVRFSHVDHGFLVRLCSPEPAGVPDGDSGVCPVPAADRCA